MSDQKGNYLQKLYTNIKVDGFSKLYSSYDQTVQGRFLQKIKKGVSVNTVKNNIYQGDFDYEKFVKNNFLKGPESFSELLKKINTNNFDNHKGPTFNNNDLFRVDKHSHSNGKNGWKKAGFKKLTLLSKSLTKKDSKKHIDGRNYDPKFNLVFKKTPEVIITNHEYKYEIKTKLKHQSPIRKVEKTEEEEVPKKKVKKGSKLFKKVKGIEFNKCTPRKETIMPRIDTSRSLDLNNSDIDYEKINKFKSQRSYVIDYNKIKLKKRGFVTSDVPSSLNYNPNFDSVREKPKNFVNYTLSLNSKERESLQKKSVKRQMYQHMFYIDTLPDI